MSTTIYSFPSKGPPATLAPNVAPRTAPTAVSHRPPSELHRPVDQDPRTLPGSPLAAQPSAPAPPYSSAHATAPSKPLAAPTAPGALGGLSVAPLAAPSAPGAVPAGAAPGLRGAPAQPASLPSAPMVRISFA